METYVYQTKRTCSREITVNYEGNTIISVSFRGGCNGNTRGVAALVAGMSIDEAIARLSGINCNGRGTSCPDQLATALTEIKNRNGR